MKNFRLCFLLIMLFALLHISSCTESVIPEKFGTLRGHVYYLATQFPIEDVQVEADGKSLTTGLDGSFLFENVPVRVLTVTASRQDFEPVEFQQRVYEDIYTTIEIHMYSSLVKTVEWIDIPAGEFTYGENDSIVTIDYDYQIMKYEVTNAQYAEFLNEAYNAGKFTEANDITVRGMYPGDSKTSAGEYEYFNVDASRIIHWDGSSFNVVTGFNNHPVVEVTWFGAWAYAEYYNYKLALPVEWEKAARGDTGWDYPWGDELAVCPQASFFGCFPGTETFPVGLTTGASPYGVYDMAGNVWEWIYNFHEGNPAYSGYRILRGGSWGQQADELQTWAGRFVREPDNSYGAIGFRCVRSD